MNTYTIRTFDDLLEFIELNENLSNEKLNEILMQTIHCLMTNDHSKNETIQILREFWETWGKQRERPIFIDISSLDVE